MEGDQNTKPRLPEGDKSVRDKSVSVKSGLTPNPDYPKGESQGGKEGKQVSPFL